MRTAVFDSINAMLFVVRRYTKNYMYSTNSSSEEVSRADSEEEAVQAMLIKSQSRPNLAKAAVFTSLVQQAETATAMRKSKIEEVAKQEAEEAALKEVQIQQVLASQALVFIVPGGVKIA